MPTTKEKLRPMTKILENIDWPQGYENNLHGGSVLRTGISTLYYISMLKNVLTRMQTIKNMKVNMLLNGMQISIMWTPDGTFGHFCGTHRFH